ncbi:MAG TPA: TIM barrel protein [Candidatus Methylacidiphilales bacterium]
MTEPGASLALGFSTLGDGDLSLEQALEWRSRLGFEAIEVRVLEGSLDLPAYFDRRGYPPVPSGEKPIRVVGTSLGILSASEADLKAFYRFAEVAHRLRAPYVRIFGDGGAAFSEPLSEAALDRAAARVEAIRDALREKRWDVELLLEMHDVFSSSERCLALNGRLRHPLGILWDSHHTWRDAGEDPEKTWGALGRWIRHVHYKDSRPKDIGAGYAYVLPGEGTYPGVELAALLRGGGFRGVLSLEWEKWWHPELPPLGEALESFAALFGRSPESRPGRNHG